jgi:2'-5' RNA ligase superfamily
VGCRPAVSRVRRMSESALIVRVSEAEPYVAHLRARFDSAAQLGVPAHITVLHPFMPPDLLDEPRCAQVQTAVSSVGAFAFRLARVQRLPGALCLAPEPAAPFVALTTALAKAFPAYPPSGGQHRAIIPHLTVARTGPSEHSEVEAELLASVRQPGGISATCTEVVLIENSSGRWVQTRAFSLGR